VVNADALSTSCPHVHRSRPPRPPARWRGAADSRAPDEVDVVEGDPIADARLGFATVGVAFQIDGLVFERAPHCDAERRPPSAMSRPRTWALIWTAPKKANSKRYRSSLPNLILTDYLEFRLYRNGEPATTAAKRGTSLPISRGRSCLSLRVIGRWSSDPMVLITRRHLSRAGSSLRCAHKAYVQCLD
jgi:hypothetical protein